MAYTMLEARERLLDEVAQAADALALALACLGEAYEQLDENSADRLEEELFRSVALAYGRLQRTYAEFAARHGAPPRTFEPAAPGAPSQGAKAFIQRAVAAAGQAAQLIAELQDSMLPIEVGDPALRAELADVRSRLDDLPARARELLRTLGR
ncbi:MAG: hypothetical protein QOF77_1131 [Solirubrobacteraceae bacterium]|jgi:hypothetical protein|nr:hypothetical protein [Solirubrobacteraceae bacterium]